MRNNYEERVKGMREKKRVESGPKKYEIEGKSEGK